MGGEVGQTYTCTGGGGNVQVTVVVPVHRVVVRVIVGSAAAALL